MAIEAHTISTFGTLLTQIGRFNSSNKPIFAPSAIQAIASGSGNGRKFNGKEVSLFLITNDGTGDVTLTIKAHPTKEMENAGITLNDTNVKIKGGDAYMFKPYNLLKDNSENQEITLSSSATGLKVLALRIDPDKP